MTPSSSFVTTPKTSSTCRRSRRSTSASTAAWRSSCWHIALEGQQVAERIAEERQPDVVAVPVPRDHVGIALDLDAPALQHRHLLFDRTGLAGHLEIDDRVGRDALALEQDDVHAVAVEQLHRVARVGGVTQAQDVAVEMLGLVQIRARQADLIDRAEFE